MINFDAVVTIVLLRSKFELHDRSHSTPSNFTSFQVWPTVTLTVQF